MAVRWIGGYWETARKHYEFGGEHFAKTKGYEFYAAMSEAQRASANQMTEMYLDLQVWGTPKMCIDRIRRDLREDALKRVHDAYSATPACRTTKLSGTCVCSPRRYCRCCRTTSSPLRPADRASPTGGFGCSLASWLRLTTV